MNRAELINAIAEYTGETKGRTKTVILGMIDVIRDTLASGEEISISDFMKFEINEVKEKTYTNRWADATHKFVKPAHKKIHPVLFSGIKYCIEQGEDNDEKSKNT